MKPKPRKKNITLRREDAKRRDAKGKDLVSEERCRGQRKDRMTWGGMRTHKVQEQSNGNVRPDKNILLLTSVIDGWLRFPMRSGTLYLHGTGSPGGCRNSRVSLAPLHRS